MKQCLLQNGKEKICYELDNHQIIRSAAKLFFFFFNSSQIDVTAQNTPKSGLSLIRIFPYIDRIVFVFPRIWAESTIYGKIRIRLYLYAGKYGPEKRRISSYFT